MKPSCSNCLRHSIECDYNSNPSSRGSSATSSTEEKKAPTSLAGSRTFISSSQSNFAPPKRAHGPRRAPVQQHEEQSSQLNQAVINKPLQFTATDMALFHHFITSKDLGASHTQLCRLGFSFHYVLRLVLAFSSFHLARNSENTSCMGLKTTDLHAVAEQHYQTAVREVTAAIPLLDTTSSPALYASAIFIFLCSLARGPRPGEYLAYRDDGTPGCLSLFMSLRSILEVCSALTPSVDLFSIHAADVQDVTIQPEEPPLHREELVSHDYRDSLAQVRHLITATFSGGVSGHEDYSQVLDRLCYSYDVVFGGHSRPTESELWPQIFGWLYKLPGVFLMDVQQRKPAALVVFAFFAVLLKQLDPAWFIRQWPEHIMDGIFHNLDQDHRIYVQWPVEQFR